MFYVRELCYFMGALSFVFLSSVLLNLDFNFFAFKYEYIRVLFFQKCIFKATSF